MPSPPHRSGRRPAWLPAALGLALLAALWSAGWFLAAHAAGVALDRWVAAEGVHGRQWTCPGRRIDGYPFVLAVRCTQPTFTGEIAGHPSVGHVEALRASIGLAHPRTVELRLQGPFYLRGQDNSFDLVASWETILVTLTGVVGQPEGSVDAARLAVTLATPDQANLNLRATHLAGTASPTANGDAPFRAAIEGVSLPTLAALPELSGPTDASAEGVLVGASRLTDPTARRLEGWRVAGGKLELAALVVRSGALAGRAAGTLALDEAHRPAGRLDASVTGFEPIAQRLGIPLAGVRLGGLLTSLLGGGKPPAEVGAVSLPLILADGHVSVGPLATGLRLDPLY